MPVWPVNQRMPSASKTAVLRFAPGRSRGEREGRDLVGRRHRPGRSRSRPPSVIQALPSGPVMTPWGADPAPSGIVRTLSGRGVEVAERAVVLARVPDAAVGRGRDVVRMRAGHDVELPDGEGDGGCSRMASRTTERRRSERSMASRPASRRRSRRSMAQTPRIRSRRRRAPATGPTGRGGSRREGRATRTDDAPQAQISRAAAHIVPIPGPQ